MIRSYAVTALLLFMTLVPSTAQQPDSVAVDAGNFDKWLAFIRPTRSELSFEQIGWRGAFWPAVEEAKKLGRPILLWTMNGHPLGCT